MKKLLILTAVLALFAVNFTKAQTVDREYSSSDPSVDYLYPEIIGSVLVTTNIDGSKIPSNVHPTFFSVEATFIDNADHSRDTHYYEETDGSVPADVDVEDSYYQSWSEVDFSYVAQYSDGSWEVENDFFYY